MKKQKNKGITMIGLSVTIIVLLLLAGATISSIVGQSGIFANMHKTQEQTKIDEENRILKASVVSAMSKDSIGNVTGDNLNEALKNNELQKDKDYKIEPIEPGSSNDKKKFKIEFVDSGNKYIVSEDGTITTEGEDNTNIVFKISPSTIPSLQVGSERTIKITTNIENADIKWTSTDKNIVYIDENNHSKEQIIKAIAPGNAQIQVSAEIKDENGNVQQVKNEMCSVTVITEATNPVEDIKLENGQNEVIIDLSSSKTTYTLTATTDPEDAKESAELQWESSNSKIASVDENGVVTANENGETIVSVKTNNGKHAEITVKVVTSPTGVTLNSPKARVDLKEMEGKDKKIKLEAKITPSTANVKTGLTWRYEVITAQNHNNDIASIDSDGTIHFKTVGKIKVIVTTENGYSADCEIDVIDSNMTADNKNDPPWWLAVASGVATTAGALYAGATVAVAAAAGLAVAGVVALVIVGIWSLFHLW